MGLKFICGADLKHKWIMVKPLSLYYSRYDHTVCLTSSILRESLQALVSEGLLITCNQFQDVDLENRIYFSKPLELKAD